jgi:hypothetical protein
MILNEIFWFKQYLNESFWFERYIKPELTVHEWNGKGQNFKSPMPARDKLELDTLSETWVDLLK